MVRKAVMLAAGRGTRLGDITLDRPKPMVPINGTPVLEHIARQLVSIGIEELLLVVGYRADAIRDHFGDGGAVGLNVHYVDQPVPDGTGSAMLLAKEFANGDPLLSGYGDILTDTAHYADLITGYCAEPCAAIIGINPVDDPSAGAAVYRDGSRITRVVEKPPPGTSTSNWNIAGVSLYSSAIWPHLEALKPSPRNEYEMTDAIQTLIASGAAVRAQEMPGYWSDVGTIAALREAEQCWPEIIERASTGRA